MDKIATILLISLGVSGLVFAALLAACTWAIHKENRREQEQIRQQLADEPFSCCYDDLDVSGLIEED